MARIKGMGLDFEFTKFDGLDGKTKCEWNNGDGALVFRADQDGIQIKGTLNLQTISDLQAFAKFLGETVWTQHRKLVPKILSPNSKDFKI